MGTRLASRVPILLVRIQLALDGQDATDSTDWAEADNRGSPAHALLADTVWALAVHTMLFGLARPRPLSSATSRPLTSHFKKIKPQTG